MTDRELMQEVLEALEEINKLSIGESAICLPAEIDGALDALRERLAQPEQCQYPDCKCATENPCLKGLAQPEQKPVSGVVLDEHGLGALVKNGSEDWHCKKHKARRLYTTPPQGIYYTPPQRKPEQEPVAWVTGWHGGHCVIRAVDPAAILQIGTALYTTPPQRKPLTEKRIEELYSFWVVDCQDIVGFARAVERTVKGEA